MWGQSRSRCPPPVSFLIICPSSGESYAEINQIFREKIQRCFLQESIWNCIALVLCLSISTKVQSSLKGELVWSATACRYPDLRIETPGSNCCLAACRVLGNPWSSCCHAWGREISGTAATMCGSGGQEESPTSCLWAADPGKWAGRGQFSRFSRGSCQEGSPRRARMPDLPWSGKFPCSEPLPSQGCRTREVQPVLRLSQVVITELFIIT